MSGNLSLLHLHLFPIVDASVVVLDRTLLIADGENPALVPLKAGDACSSPTAGHLLGLDVPEFDIIVRGPQSQ